MAEERKLRLGIDASGAQQGAQEFEQSTQKIRRGAKETSEAIRAMERAIGASADSFGKRSPVRAISESSRNALGSILQYNQQISASLKKTGEVANAAGFSIAAAMQRAGSSVVSTGGNLRFGVGSLSNELLGAAGNAEGMASSLGLSAGAIGGITAVGAAVAALGYGLFQGAKNALALEKSLILIAARTDPSQFSRYKDAALELSKTLGVDATQAGQAFTAALVSGFSEFDDQVKAATLGLKLFKAGEGDASQSIALLDRVLDVYNLTAADAEETTNKLLRAAHANGTTFMDLAAAVGEAGLETNRYGLSLDENIGLLASIAEKTGGASGAAAGYTNFLLQLAKSGSTVNDVLRTQGVIVDAEAIKLRGYPAILQEVARAFEGKENLLANAIGSPRLAEAAFALLDASAGRTEASIKAVKAALDELGRSVANVKLLPSDEIERARQRVSGFFTKQSEGLLVFTSDMLKLVELADNIGNKSGGYLQDSQGRASKSIEQVNAGLKEQQLTLDEIYKAYDQAGMFKTSGPDVPTRPKTPGPPPNLPPASSPLTPDFDQTLSKAQDEITALSASLTVELGGALAKENAQLRATENEVRKKIEAFQKLGLDTSDLTVQLFALTNQNDELAKSFGYAGQAIGPDLDGKFQQLNKDAAALAETIDQELGTAFEQQVVSIRSSENALRTQIDALEASGVQTDELRQKLALLASQNDVTAAGLGQKAFDEGIGKNLRDLEFQNSLIGETADEQARLTALREFDAAAIELQKQSFEDMTPAIMAAREQLEMLLADERLKRQAEELGHAIADPLTDGFESVVLRTKSMGDALEDVYRQIVANLLKQLATNQLNQGLVGLFGQLFGGGGPGSNSGGGGNYWTEDNWRGGVYSNGSRIPFAQGGIPHGPSVVPFAYGDIVRQPTTFPMSRGRTGLMGERGMEAIMPVLARGPSGRLGVELVGGSKNAGQPTVTTIDQSRSMAVTVNLNDPGDKRSRRQMLDDMSRMSRSA